MIGELHFFVLMDFLSKTKDNKRKIKLDFLSTFSKENSPIKLMLIFFSFTSYILIFIAVKRLIQFLFKIIYIKNVISVLLNRFTCFRIKKKMLFQTNSIMHISPLQFSWTVILHCYKYQFNVLKKNLQKLLQKSGLIRSLKHFFFSSKYVKLT